MSETRIPLFGARKFARSLLERLAVMEADMQRLGLREVVDLEAMRADLEKQTAELKARYELMADELKKQHDHQLSEYAQQAMQAKMERDAKVLELVATSEEALLQEVGRYHYRHPLADVVAYRAELDRVQGTIKAMLKKDGGAVNAATNWTVNGSEAQGRKMVTETSKLMLRAFNAEADHLVRTLKPYKLDAAIDRLEKVAETIERLGRTMSISISRGFITIRRQELELTADFLQKEDEHKQIEREERERLREERKAQQEMERERVRLEKERQHYANAMQALAEKGDAAAIERMQEQLADVQRALDDVDYRVANIRAGYVYVISNIGSFGGDMVKIGMTRRLDPMDRVRELGDASVPFNFDVHALFFSKDAVTIETEMHRRLAAARVNQVNLRREFFHVTPLEAKRHLAELSGDILQFQDEPEAIEYRESLAKAPQ